uniref:WD_REPEATS_REGION domain-containing protein n=1 Tax=Syphacia muris TaxID=451379 RepID=A0A0N5AMR9_9BILA
MSSSENNKLVLYSLHGELLKAIEPKLNILYEALVTPCGRFIAASGFTPDVLVFEVMFDRQGNFQDVKRAFELKGHTSGVSSFAFNQDSTRCATASKDGTWRLYDTDIRYTLGEEAKTLASGEWDLLRNVAPESVSVAMSASGNSFAVGASRHIQLFSAVDTSKNFNLILDVHQEMISRIRMSPCGKMLASCGDRYVRIFHNVAEYYSTVVTLERALAESRKDAQKRRIQEQLEEARIALDKVLKN